MNPSKQPTAQEKLSATYWLLPVTGQYGMRRLLINRSPLPSPRLDPLSPFEHVEAFALPRLELPVLCQVRDVFLSAATWHSESLIH